MTQLGLFEPKWLAGQERSRTADAPAGRLARRTDPETSHLAAQEVAGSPVLTTQLDRLEKLVEQYPDLTSAELSQFAFFLPPGTRRNTVAKRLPTLRDVRRTISNGEKRKCRATGRWAMTWRRVESPAARAVGDR